MRRKVKILWIFLGVVLLWGCKNQTSETFTASGTKLNTYVSITLYAGGSQNLADQALELCDYYEDIFSARSDGALLYRLNDSGGMEIQTKEQKELVDLIQTGIEYGNMTEGALDIGLEKVTGLWSFGTEEQRLPSEGEIQEALQDSDYHSIEISDTQIALNGCQVDLGAVAKGRIADRIKTYLMDHGVTSAIINLGGNILCIGTKPDGSSFVIGVQKPFGESNEIALTLRIQNMSVVTSGIYERYFEEGGVLYHHILDPETGYPCNNGLQSVTIISKDSTICDCLSTGCFVLGKEKALELLNSMDGVYGIFIDSDNQYSYSKGAENFLAD